MFGEQPAAYERRAERPKIVSTNNFAVHVRLLPRHWCWLSFAGKRYLPGCQQRRIGPDRDFLDAGHGCNFAEQCVVKIDYLLVITISGVGKVDAGRDQALRIKSQPKFLQTGKAFQNEAGRTEKNQS